MQRNGILSSETEGYVAFASLMFNLQARLAASSKSDAFTFATGALGSTKPA
jgi:hypothetical protein